MRTQTRSWKTSVEDWKGKCAICGDALEHTETFLNYVEGGNTDGRTSTFSRGIWSIDDNAGVCDTCLKKHLRKSVEEAFKRDETGFSGVFLCGVGIFLSVLAFLIVLVNHDGKLNILSYVLIAATIAFIIGCIICNKHYDKLQNSKEDRMKAELSLSDEELLEKYNKDNAYLKIAFHYPHGFYPQGVNQIICKRTDSPTVSEILKLGSVEEIAKKIGVSTTLAEQLLNTATAINFDKTGKIDS
ncbi:MAG: hypothetical protein II650_01135 [Clostridia bacterium]|nr:hypothetical protein [Clostridia bacterium]MBR4186409.1 hypothetical protein [Clostridia bacterium]